MKRTISELTIKTSHQPQDNTASLELTATVASDQDARNWFGRTLDFLWGIGEPFTCEISEPFLRVWFRLTGSTAADRMMVLLKKLTDNGWQWAEE